VLNYIWLGLILCAVIFGGLTHHMEEVAQEGIKGAEKAVEIALKLIGVMALWLGVMRLADKAGLVAVLARAIRPVMRRLFPEVPPDHPAMGSMMMNMAANILGIGNAATPFGLRAMKDLQRLNPRPDTATNAMCTFLAINTSSIQLIPANQIAMLAAAGSLRPTAIIGTAIIATTVSTIVGIVSVKLLARTRWFRLPPAPAVKDAGGETPDDTATAPAAELRPLKAGGKLALLAFAALVIGIFYAMTFPKDRLPAGEARVTLCENGRAAEVLRGRVVAETTSNLTVQIPDGATKVIAREHAGPCPKAAGKSGAAALHAEKIERHKSSALRAIDSISILAIPFLVAFFPLYAALRGIKVYEEFVEGAKEGFSVVLMIIPHVVAMLVAVYMFRAAGCIDVITGAVGPLMQALHFPAELLPMSLLRPISGAGTTAMFIEMIQRFGPDHLITRTAATIIGSTETTLYVLAVYFGSVAIKRARHAVAAGLLADAAGIIASIIICRLVFA
jgi:spore maturation protein SpmA